MSQTKTYTIRPLCWKLFQSDKPELRFRSAWGVGGRTYDIRQKGNVWQLSDNVMNRTTEHSSPSGARAAAEGLRANSSLPPQTSLTL